jgi:Holliday junction resolvase RusA-like endonuclease
MVERVKQSPVHVFKSTKPDLPDNLNKLVFDAMKGIVFTDDKLIVGIENCYKYYGLQPKTIIVLERMVV